MDSLEAYTSLESAILTGELKPCERLVEQELAARLGMSRTPIREALRRLEERGLVRILPHRGAVVAEISPVDIENIYTVRCHVESLAARLAAERLADRGPAHPQPCRQLLLDQALAGFQFPRQDRTLEIGVGLQGIHDQAAFRR